jgi:rhomboid protease GluP
LTHVSSAEVANCVQCGKELPRVTTGELRDSCAECQVRERIAREQQARANRPSFWQIAKLFPATSTIVAINILVYLGCAAESLVTHTGSPASFKGLMLLQWGANFGPLTLDHQFWRIFTCMFLHFNIIHIAGNMWCLWEFGRIAERVFGRWLFVALYVLTGLAASVGSLAIHPMAISVGASGAIFGVVGTLVFPFYRKRVVVPSPVMKEMMRSLATFIIINLLIGSAVTIIDNAAHVGGLIGGLILGAVVTRMATRGTDLHSSVPRIAAVSAIVIGLAFAGVQHLHRATALAMGSMFAGQQGDSTAAMDQAKRAVTANPKSAIAHVALAEAYFAQHRYADAATQYKSAYDLDPSDPEAAGRVGAAYVAAAQWKEAEAWLWKAVEADPNDARSLQALGITLAAQGRPQEGLRFVEEAVLKNPKSASAHYALGSVLMDLHNYDEALGPLQQAVKLDPQNTDYKKTVDAVAARVAPQSVQSK